MARNKHFTLKHNGLSWKIEYASGDLLKKTLKGKEVNSILIRAKTDISPGLKKLNKDNGILSNRKIAGSDYVYELLLPATSLKKINDLTNLYYDSGMVEFAEPQFISGLDGNISLAAETEPDYSKQWIFENTGQYGGNPQIGPKIGKALKWIQEKKLPLNEEVCIAVLDEGVDINHEEFAKAGLMHKPFSVFGNNNTDPSPKSDAHHGTQITGVIGAINNNGKGIAGINPFCRIMPGRLYYEPNGVRPTNLADGIKKAIDNGARILNLSWAIKPSSIVTDAIWYAVDQGALVIAAAGNYKSGESTAVKFPGSLDEVITVGAHDPSGRWINLSNSPKQPKFGSCYGRELDISAPGAHICATLNKNKYTDSFCGTSAATAIVSAVAALIWAINPNLSPSDITSILYASADPVTDADDLKYISDRYGHGRLNAIKAVQMAAP